MKLIPEVGGPECRPRGGGAEVTGSTHDVPLLVVGERGELAALFSMSVRADGTFEASGCKEEEVVEVRSGVGIPGGVASLGSSAAHLRQAVVEKAGLLGHHGCELRVGTGPAIPQCGHHSGLALVEAVSGPCSGWTYWRSETGLSRRPPTIVASSAPSVTRA